MSAATGTREDLAKVDELQMRYIDALGERDMKAWLALFSPKEDASYVFTTAESVESNFPVAVMLDDCRGRLEDRVTFITKIWTGTFQDYRMRHTVQRVRSEPDCKLWRVSSNFRVT